MSRMEIVMDEQTTIYEAPALVELGEFSADTLGEGENAYDGEAGLF